MQKENKLSWAKSVVTESRYDKKKSITIQITSCLSNKTVCQEDISKAKLYLFRSKEVLPCNIRHNNLQHILFIFSRTYRRAAYNAVELDA